MNFVTGRGIGSVEFVLSICPSVLREMTLTIPSPKLDKIYSRFLDARNKIQVNFDQRQECSLFSSSFTSTSRDIRFDFEMIKPRCLPQTLLLEYTKIATLKRKERP